VFVEGGIYQVYKQFARGAELFADPEEAIEFLEILRQARDRGVRGHGADGAPGICKGARHQGIDVMIVPPFEVEVGDGSSTAESVGWWDLPRVQPGFSR
jgi:hypothetical protein